MNGNMGLHQKGEDMQKNPNSEKMYEVTEIVDGTYDSEMEVKSNTKPTNAKIKGGKGMAIMARKVDGEGYEQKPVEAVNRDKKDREGEAQQKNLVIMAKKVNKVEEVQKCINDATDNENHEKEEEQHKEKIIMARVADKNEKKKPVESTIIVPEAAHNMSSSLTEAEMSKLLQAGNRTESIIQKEVRAVGKSFEFEERENGLYMGGKLVANCKVRILSLEVFEMENGSSQKSFVCQIIIPNRIPIVTKVSVEEFRDGKWLKQCPYVTFKCASRKAFGVIFLYLNDVLEKYAYKIVTIFETPGWKQINGELRYVTPGGVIGTNYDIKSQFGVEWIPFEVNCDEKMRYLQFLSMRKLTPDKQMAPILQLYMIQSVLYTWFESVNATPKYCLFIEGQKGTHKTSLALTMTQFGGLKTPRFTFMSSQAGLEAGFVDYFDAVMLVDDLMPIESGSVKNTIEGNLEFLVRLFGDGTGKMRNLDFCDSGRVRQYRTHGGCVFTGEYYIGCGSSLARMLVLHCDKNDIDIQRLTEYQNHPEILDQFVQSFLSYISKEWIKLVTYMRQYFEDRRRRAYGSFSNPRYGEYYAQLMLAAEILAQYGAALGVIKQEERGNFISEYENIIMQVLHANDKKLLDEEPVVKIAKAVFEAYDNAEVRQKIFTKNMIKDDFYYHMTEADLLRCYRCFCSRYGMEDFSCKSRRLIGLLVNAGAVEAEMEGNAKRYATKMPGYGNQRFLHIKKNLICTLAGEKKEVTK